MIGIIGAMQIEIDKLESFMVDVKKQRISSIEFVTGKIQGIECVVAFSGIGKVNAAVCSEIMILIFNASTIINIGVAGGIGKDIKINDIVVASDVIQHDFDTSAIGDPKGMISGLDLIKFACCEKINKKIFDISDKMFKEATHLGTILTGDQFINDNEKLNNIKNKFGGIACDMESGAIGQVCTLNNIPFVVIRAISDNADENVDFDYNEFLETASKKAIDLILYILPTLKPGDN